MTMRLMKADTWKQP